MNQSRLYFIIRASAPGPAPFQTDIYIATNGQTVFPLSMLPAAPVNLVFSVNGQVATPGLDYTEALGVVTWLNTDFMLQFGDEVVAYYERV